MSMRTLFNIISGLAVLSCLLATEAAAAVRLKDIVDIEGIRDNQLVGYGLVVGLNGTGDELRNSPFTQQSLTAMLERLGVNTRGSTMKTKNVAAVMVTAKLPAFAHQGSKIDVDVSAMGDAKDLKGGTLLVTPLLGADGEVYAVAQGTVAVAGFSAQGDAQKIVQGVPTSGRIAGGANIEREIKFDLDAMPHVRLTLKNPDVTTAKRIADAVNGHFGFRAASALDPTTVRIDRQPLSGQSIVEIIAGIEMLQVQPDVPAKVIIDERSGIIVMGAEVKISNVAIAQGNLTIKVTETPQVSQPAPFSQGQTTTVPRTQIEVDKGEDKRLAVLKSGVSLQDLVDGLNSLGVGPRDMISILQAVKASGAMQADLEVM